MYRSTSVERTYEALYMTYYILLNSSRWTGKIVYISKHDTILKKGKKSHRHTYMDSKCIPIETKHFRINEQISFSYDANDKLFHIWKRVI